MSAPQPGEPPDPQSPRPVPTGIPTRSDERTSPADTATAPAPATNAAPGLADPRVRPLAPGSLVGFAPPPPQPRPNLGSLLFMSAMFFLMSGNNGPAMQQPIGFDPEGNVVHRVTALEKAQTTVDEYKGFLNGTGNWTEGVTPAVLPGSILPSRYRHDAARHSFYTNITGFYRDAKAHTISLIDPTRVNHHRANHSVTFFDGVRVPDLNGSATSTWNETRARELRGEWPWPSVNKWDMNLKERIPEGINQSAAADWYWVRGSASVQAGEDQAIEYGLCGLHYVPNGTYELYGLPDGKDIDARNIPRLFPHHHNVTRGIILAELEKELKKQQNVLLQPEARVDDVTVTSCPLMLHLSVPPIPAGSSPGAVAQWEEEMANPTGIRSSLHRPPSYWEGIGLGGVAVADECGFAFGIEGGKGLRLDDFWQKSVNYAAYATAAQLLVLVVLVRQMDFTRTPSTLAKVSLWSIVLMGIADSWLFSAHVVVGIVSENRASVPMLVPGFLCLCTAIVFGPRYAVMLYRVQAPERSATPPRPPPRPAPAGADGAEGAATPGTNTALPAEPAEPSYTFSERIVSAFASNPLIRWLALLTFLGVSVMSSMMPGVLELLLFTLYSFWVPQIWRNARRGSSGALQWPFILGTTAGRLALLLYAFACPDNVFFIEAATWVWLIALWQLVQVAMLFAQEVFGAAFFLPKLMQPAESYNYHPLLQPPDAESGPLLSGPAETTCSICMEEVDIGPHGHGTGSSARGSTASSAGEAILGLGNRRAYALAPCHHLFHTKCLAQWLAIKTICPLCKRSLPPL